MTLGSWPRVAGERRISSMNAWPWSRLVSGRLRPAGRCSGRACGRCRRRCRGDLHQADGVGGADRFGAEIAFLDDVGVGQGGIDPPAGVGRPARRGIAVGGGDAGAGLAVMREPELRPAEVERARRGDRSRLLGGRADLGLVAQHLLGEAALADRDEFRGAADIGASASRRLGRAARGGAGCRPCRACRARAGRRSSRERAARSSRPWTSPGGGRPAPRAPPNKPRRR